MSKKMLTDKIPKIILKRIEIPTKSSPEKVNVKIGSSVIFALLQAESKSSPKTRKRAKSPRQVKEKHCVDHAEPVQKQMKKGSGPKRTLLKVEKKPANPVTRAKNKRRVKIRRKSVKPANISQEIGPDNPDNILSKEGLTASEVALALLQAESKSSPKTRKQAKSPRQVKEKHCVDDAEPVQKQMKKGSGPKRTLLKVEKKPANPVTRAKNKRRVKIQRKSVKPANISQEIGPDNPDNILSKEGLAASEVALALLQAESKSSRKTRKRAKSPRQVKEKHCVDDAEPVQKQMKKGSGPKRTSLKVEKKPANPVTRAKNKRRVKIQRKSVKPANISQEIGSDNPDNILSKEGLAASEVALALLQAESKSSPKTRKRAKSPRQVKEKHCVDDAEPVQKQMKKGSGPKRTLLKVEKKPANPVTRAKNKRRVKIQRKSVKPANISQEIGPDNPDNILSKEGLAASEGCKDVAAVVGFPSPPQPKNRPKSVISNKSYLTWTKDISTESSIEKSVERHRTADFTVQNESDDKSLADDKQLVSNINRVEAAPTDSFKTFTSDDVNDDVPFDGTHDDEDVISLYAESISGMESSSLDSDASVCTVSQDDAYVPKYSSTSCMPAKYIDRPTKIQVHRSNLADESMEDCEIISIASSGSKDTNITAMELPEESNRISSIAVESIKKIEPQIWSQPLRPFSSYQNLNPMNPTRSSLYREQCFSYVATNQCNNLKCLFSHNTTIDPNKFRYLLTGLTEDNLIEEYLLMCRYPNLRRKLCMFFLDECERRFATRIFIEMSIDLGLGLVKIPEDLRVKVLEKTLLYLNTICYDACDDLLKFKYRDTTMCDALLLCIANSQNFTQFKKAFGILAEVICELKRPVDIQVASSILERVCILPWEFNLARGMLTLMKNTDVSIFESSLAQSFEVQLSVNDRDVHEVYLLAKKAALEGRMHPATPFLKPHGAQNGPRLMSPDSTTVRNLPETLLLLNSAPRCYVQQIRLVEPRMPHWRRGGYNTREASRRGRQNTRMPDRAYQWCLFRPVSSKRRR